MVKGDLLPGITIGELTDFTFEGGGDIFYFLINIFLSFLTITSTLTEMSEFLGPPHGGKSEIGWNRLAGLGRRLGVERKLYPDSEYGDGA